MPKQARGFVVLGATLTLAAGGALAGGPSFVRSNGTPFVWNTSVPIAYRTDNGPLSASVAEIAARSRVLAMFNVWQDVPSAAISYTHAGFINDAGAFTDGDVSTLAEYNAVLGDCEAGNQNPVIYDADAAIIDCIGQGRDVSDRLCRYLCARHRCGSDHKRPRPHERPVPGWRGQTADSGPDRRRVRRAFIHEFGHFSGLDHSQVNVECADGSCISDDRAGLPTMFPFLVSDAQGTLSIDDIAWISRLYPAAGRKRLCGDARHDHRHRVFFRRRIAGPTRQRGGAARRQSRDSRRQREPHDGGLERLGLQVPPLPRESDQRTPGRAIWHRRAVGHRPVRDLRCRLGTTWSSSSRSIRRSRRDRASAVRSGSTCLARRRRRSVR